MPQVKQKLCRFMVAAALLAAPACVTATGGDDGGGHVIERSKPEAPPWTALAAGRLHEAEPNFSYVQIETKLRDLPLGLKQTQLHAVEASRNAFQALVRDKLEDDRDRLPAASQAEFDRKVTDITREVHTLFAKVSDIYFEKLGGGPETLPEYFNAFVLVTYPKDRIRDVYETLGKRLSQSGDGSLRSVGQGLLSRVKSGGLSH